MNDPINVLTLFLFNIVLVNIPLLYGTVGEIVVEKSGSLDLGVEGTMAVGAIFGYLAGCAANSILVGLAVSFLTAGLCGLLFALLTVSLQANQNVTGLTINGAAADMELTEDGLLQQVPVLGEVAVDA